MGIFRRKKQNKASLTQFFYSQIIGSNPVVFYNYNQEDFISKGYSSNGEIYSIIEKITNKCNVSTPYIYIDKEGIKSKRDSYRKARDTVYGVAKYRLYAKKALDYAPEENDLSGLIKNPNETQTWREFITLARIFYQVQGESFIYRESDDNDCALSLHIAPAHRMNSIIELDDFGVEKIAGWKYKMLNGNVRKFETKDVLHLKRPNPNFDASINHLRGMSPLVAGLKYLQLDDKSIEAWLKSMENEGAKGIISPNHANPELWLTPDQVKTTQEKVEEKISGMANRNKIVVSGMPLQYTQIGLSPDALNIINGLEHSGHKLCDLWGVPSVLFDANPTYENQREAGKRLVLEVVLPYLNFEEDKLNAWLVEPFAKRDKKKYVLDYDLSAYEELRLSVSDTEAFLKTHTINEVRVMLGSDELEDEYANQVFIQQGLVPLSDYNIDQGI
jgi:HK97 family phage portal protein